MNPNLLKITSIPISIEVNVTNGSLKAPEDKGAAQDRHKPHTRRI